MSDLWRKISMHRLVLRYTRWEYFPIWLAHIPLVFVYIYYALRTRRLFFFTTVNPAIDTAGAFGESKIDILRKLPQDLIPETVFIVVGTNFDTLLEKLENSNLDYPIIAKPDVGERGLGVQKIKNEKQLGVYAANTKVSFMLQAFLDYPIEVAVLYYRYPDKKQGHIPSFCTKAYLSVIGDGKSRITDLMAKDSRANLQIERLTIQQPELLNQIPTKGERVELEPIGNHSRGTMFLNGNANIDEALVRVFDDISHQVEGVYYGRYDIKCQSIETLKQGKDFKIMELNGIVGEAAHVYDPSYPIWKKYRDIMQCWHAIYEISEQQRKKGLNSLSLSEIIQKYKVYQQKINATN